MTRIVLPALTVLVVVAALVGLAGWNRSGEPRLSIVLTERELPLLAGTDEESRASLGVVFEHRDDPLDSLNWLSGARLRELGFPLNVQPGDPAAADAYRNLPPRVAWIALEHNGPAWQDIERRRVLRAASQSPSRHQTSRLVPVDAGLDFDILRAKYPQGHLILRAVIAVSYLEARDGGPLVYGWLREVVPSAINVPKAFRPVVDALTPADAAPVDARGDHPAAEQPAVAPRYEVDVAIGRLGLPYLRGMRRLGP